MKISVSARLEEALVKYLDSYQQTHKAKSRSEALEQAIRALQERDLRHEYRAAMDEWDASDDREAWDQTAGDGLEKDPHETW